MRTMWTALVSLAVIVLFPRDLDRAEARTSDEGLMSPGHSHVHALHPYPSNKSTNWEMMLSAEEHNGMSTRDAMILELHRLRARYHDLRKRYGALSCTVPLSDGGFIGPTGGFCLDPVSPQPVGGNNLIDLSLCRGMSEMFMNSSILDLGCGMGAYGECLLSSPSSTGMTWQGYDGSENIEEATRGRVTFMDLSSPQWLGQRFDWVLSLEVGEHLPQQFELIFIRNLVRHARRGIVLTWAVEGQPGHHHVNGHSHDYTINKLKEEGASYDAESSERLQNSSTFEWFKKSVMVFRTD